MIFIHWLYSCTEGFDSLFVAVKEVSGPSIHEAWVPGEPQRHHEAEEQQHIALSVADGPQAPVLVLDQSVGRLLLLRGRRPTAPRPEDTEGNH